MRLELNSVVVLPDGTEATVEDVVIEPTLSRVSHLVVAIRHRSGDARLVPIEEVSQSSGHLRCARSLEQFPQVESTQFVRMSAPLEIEGDWEVGIEEVSALPYYGVESDSENARPWRSDMDEEVGVTFHRIPKDRVEIRRRSEVIDAEDRTIGHVDGFLVDDTDHITHLVLAQGHFLGRHAVTVPIGAVAETMNDRVRLSLAAPEVKALPRVGVRALWRP